MKTPQIDALPGCTPLGLPETTPKPVTPAMLTAAYQQMLRTANIELLVLGCDAAQTAATEAQGMAQSNKETLVPIVKDRARAAQTAETNQRDWRALGFTVIAFILCALLGGLLARCSLTAPAIVDAPTTAASESPVTE